MCLHTLTIKKFDADIEKIGYKILRCKNLRGPFRGTLGKCRPNNVWITDHSNQIIGSFFLRYPSGFHIHSTKRGAERQLRRSCLQSTYGPVSVFRVKFKQIVVQGTEGGFPVYVAKKMMILDKV